MNRMFDLKRFFTSVPSDISACDPSFQDFFRQCKPFTMTSVERMYALYLATEYIHRARVPGAVVECGVWRGGSAMISALTLMRLGDRNRFFYLYDTYTGMAEPSEQDVRVSHPRVRALSEWKTKNRKNHNAWCFASVQDVQENLRSTGYSKDRLFFIEGKVEETIPAQAPEQIALLRLDTDWYASTKHELEHLFPRLVSGGVLIIDDYGHWAGSKKAVDEYFADYPILLNRIDEGRIGVKV